MSGEGDVLSALIPWLQMFSPKSFSHMRRRRSGPALKTTLRCCALRCKQGGAKWTEQCAKEVKEKAGRAFTPLCSQLSSARVRAPKKMDGSLPKRYEHESVWIKSIFLATLHGQKRGICNNKRWPRTLVKQPSSCAFQPPNEYQEGWTIR